MSNDKIQTNPIGIPKVDQILTSLVDKIESEFPDRVRGYYVEGSYANQTALGTSDLDMVILFKNRFINETEFKQAEQITNYFDGTVDLELDIEILAEEQISNGVPPSLKLGSKVIYGVPLPDEWPLISIEEWTSERMHAAYWLINKVFNRPIPVSLPLDYPKPDGLFYGYTERIIKLKDGREANSTRDLIRVIGWAGTALIALKSKQIVSRKKECHLLYRELVNDEWSSLFESIYTKCREEWQYKIPKSGKDQKELRSICQRALAFENHFLHLHRQFLISELALTGAFQNHAVRVQTEIPYLDPDVVASLRNVSLKNLNANII